MTHTLITFLGRTPKGESGYRTTCYDFGDGGDCEPLAFFGWALQRRLQPDRLVVLGTAGSMWDHLFEGDIDLENDADEDRLDLVDEVQQQSVTTERLQRLAPVLAEKLGCKVHLRLIPYCRTKEEQIELLRVLADEVEEGDAVDLDVTHGFRHLPMLALLSALHLRRARDAEIRDIWYGSFDPDTKKAPVMRLGGLLAIAQWLEALAVYDHSADYGVFAPLTGDAGELLSQAAFFERTSNPVKARQKLQSWRSREDRIPEMDPISTLFGPELEERVAWANRPNRGDWEAHLAKTYLENGDYLRAAIYGMEAAISARAQRKGLDTNDYQARDGQRKELIHSVDGFRTLNNLRNAMAHGVLGTDKRIRKIVASESNLRNTLKSLLKQILDQRT